MSITQPAPVLQISVASSRRRLATDDATGQLAPWHQDETVIATGAANTDLATGLPTATPGSRRTGFTGRVERGHRLAEQRSPLDVASDAFTALVTEPQPLAVDGTRLGSHLPKRAIPLDELAVILMDPDTDFTVWDEVWRKVAALARSGNPAWVIGAVGLALPCLRNIAGRLARGYTGDLIDLDAEVLTGFLDALRRFSPTYPRLITRLLDQAHSAGRRARRAHDRNTATCAESPDPHDESPDGHRHDQIRPLCDSGGTETVLATLVARGIIRAEEATLVAATRLGELTLRQAARRLGVKESTLNKRRRSAEIRIGRALGFSPSAR